MADGRGLPILYGGALMTENNDNQSIDVFSRKWLLVVILCMVPPFLLFALQGDPGKGRAAAICTGVLMTAIRALWSLKSHVWFWVTAALMVIFHASLVLFVPWPSGSFPAYSLLPVAVLDYGIVWGCIKLVEKLMTRNAGVSSPR